MFIFLGLVKFGGLMAYLIPIICWTLTALIILYITSLENPRIWFNKQVTLTALLIAALQLSALIGISFFTSFGKSPYVFTLTSIALYIPYFASPLIALELSRAYLIKSCPKRKIFTGLALTALFYTFITFPISKFLTLGEPAETAKFLGSDLLPALAQSLLATYFALLGGPTASIAYLGTLEAFEWLSPILPNPPWAIKALITTLIPAIGFLAVNETVSPSMLMRYGILSRAEIRSKIRRTKKSSSLSWMAIAIIGVILVWSTTGLLGFTPTIIASGSMQPTLNVGDIAIVVSTPAKTIKIGDIIQYRTAQNQEPTIHRVIDKYQSGGLTWFITQGDANNAPDDPINEKQVTGKVVLTIPKLGWVSIYIKEFAANAYTFLTVTLPKAITEGGTFILANTIPITAALTLTAYTYLLFTYHKTTGKEGKNE